MSRGRCHAPGKNHNHKRLQVFLDGESLKLSHPFLRTLVSDVPGRLLFLVGAVGIDPELDALVSGDAHVPFRTGDDHRFSALAHPMASLEVNGDGNLLRLLIHFDVDVLHVSFSFLGRSSPKEYITSTL